MMEKYEELEISVIFFEGLDVITGSTDIDGEEIEVPNNPNP